MRSVHCAIASVLAFVCVVASVALADDAALKGLKAVKLEITIGADNERGCNPDKGDVAKQTAGALTAAGLQPSDQATLLFTVEVTGEHRQRVCQFTYEVSVHKTLKAMLPELGHEVTGDFVLWDDDDEELTAVLSRFGATWKKVQ